MMPSRVRVFRDPERLLRSLCRCDGLKDVAVVAALLVVAGAVAVRLELFRLAVTSFF